MERSRQSICSYACWRRGVSWSSLPVSSSIHIAIASILMVDLPLLLSSHIDNYKAANPRHPCRLRGPVELAAVLRCLRLCNHSHRLNLTLELFFELTQLLTCLFNLEPRQRDVLPADIAVPKYHRLHCVLTDEIKLEHGCSRTGGRS